MKRLIEKFADEEFGNAVVDWTVLMAGTVLLAVAVVTTIVENMHGLNDQTVDALDQVEVNAPG